MTFTEETARRIALALGAGAIALLAGCAGSQPTGTAPGTRPALGSAPAPDVPAAPEPPPVLDPCPPCGRG